MAKLDVYLYGQTVLSTIHKLAGKFPEIDGYGEIQRSFLCPGGEVMNAAMLLSGLGLSTAIGGPHWGTETAEVLGRYAERYSIDTSGVVRDPGFAGLRDLILVDDRHRTVFGTFGAYFSQEPPRWSEPDAAAIQAARVVAIDPYFRSATETTARIVAEAGKPYVTIDCPHDGFLHRRAAARFSAPGARARSRPSSRSGSKRSARWARVTPSGRESCLAYCKVGPTNGSSSSLRRSQRCFAPGCRSPTTCRPWPRSMPSWPQRQPVRKESWARTVCAPRNTPNTRKENRRTMAGRGTEDPQREDTNDPLSRGSCRGAGRGIFWRRARCARARFPRRDGVAGRVPEPA